MNARRLSTHLQIPLFRNSYALVLNTATTSALGVLYWAVAARLYSAEDVGINAAMISAMVFLAKIAQLNLVNALNRFVPAAGRDTGRLITWSYLIAVPLAVVVGLVFVAGLGIWAPELEVIRSSIVWVAGFVLATIAWAVFVLQDAALTGLRRATWVLAENSIYGVLKIGLLFVMVLFMPRIGIFASWTAPLVFMLVPINLLIFRRAAPHHVAATRHAHSGFDARSVARFAAGDFVASFGWTATTHLLPLIVLALAGPETNAYFYLAWTIAYALFSIARSTGMSLITEAALDPRRLWSYSRKVLVQTGALVLPIAAGLAIFAPQVLSVFGADYSVEGSTMLRLLALAAIPKIVINLYVSMLRVERRIRALAILHYTLGSAVVTLSVVLLDTLGITGVGWAWLITMTLVATVLLLTEMRAIWLPTVAVHPAAQRTTSWLVGLLRRDPQTRSVESDLQTVIRDVQALGEGWAGPLRVVGRSDTARDLSVATLGVSPSEPKAVVKLAKTATASASLRQEANALRSLHGDPRLKEWSAAHAPRLVASGTTEHGVYTVQRHVVGMDGCAVVAAGGDIDAIVLNAARAISALHVSTTSTMVVDDAALSRMVEMPLHLVTQNGKGSLPRQHVAAIDRLTSQIGYELGGRLVTTGWIHGDFWLGNVVLRETGELAGIVDWGGMDSQGLPDIDIVHLMLTARMAREGRELGSVVMGALDDTACTEAEATLLSMIDLEMGSSRWRALVLLTWIHHLASNVRKSDRYRSNWLWVARNVDHVLSTL